MPTFKLGGLSWRKPAAGRRLSYATEVNILETC